MNRIIFILTMTIIFLPISLFSYGIGGYLSGSVGYIELKKDINILTSPKVKSNESSITSSWGFGMIIDSNLSKDDLLNYRFKLGYEKIYFNNISQLSSGLLKTTHIFGIKLIKTNTYRFWIGPQIGINYQGIHQEIRNGIIIDPVYLMIANGLFRKNVIRYNLVNFNSGLALGCNFNFNNNFTLSIDLSLLAIYSIGYCKNKIYPEPNSFSNKRSICSNYGFESNFAISFLRRFGESNI